MQPHEKSSLDLIKFVQEISKTLQSTLIALQCTPEVEVKSLLLVTLLISDTLSRKHGAGSDLKASLLIISIYTTNSFCVIFQKRDKTNNPTQL